MYSAFALRNACTWVSNDKVENVSEEPRAFSPETRYVYGETMHPFFKLQRYFKVAENFRR